MAIKKIGDKWVLDFRVDGKKSERIRKKFDKKIDAQVWHEEFKEKQKKFTTSNLIEVNPEAVTFEREATYWQSKNRFKLSESHMKRADAIIEYLKPKYGSLTLDKFSPELLTDFQKEMIDKGKARATVNRYTEVICAVINYSIKHRRFPVNPLVGFEKLSGTKSKKEHWNEEEAQSFLAFANDKYPRGSEKRWVYVAYYTLLNSGVRAGEIWGIFLSDLHRNRKAILLQRQFNRVTKKFDEMKGKKNTKGAQFRWVPCHQDLLTEIDHHVEQYGIKPNDLLFSSGMKGKPVCHDTFAKGFFKKDVEQWGGKRIRFHDLRRTSGTLMAGAGIDLITIKDIYGHVKIETTMEYLNVLEENVSRVADNFAIKPKVSEQKTKLRLVGE